MNSNEVVHIIEASSLNREIMLYRKSPLLFSLSLLSVLFLVLVITESYVSAAGFSSQVHDDLYLQDTEAHFELQAPLQTTLRDTGQVPEIIGLFAVAQNSNEFLAVSSNGKVSIWPLKTGTEKVIFPEGEPNLACAYNAKLNYLAVAQDTGISLYDLNSKIRLKRSPALGTKPSTLEFALDGTSLLIGGEDGKVYRWRLSASDEEDPDKQIEVERYIGHAASVTALAYHPFSRMFLSADSFGSIAAWLTYDKDLFGGKYDERLNQTTFYTEDGPRALAASVEDTTVLALRISKDGQNVFVALQDGRVEWLLVRGLKLVVVSKANKGAIYDMQISPSGKLLATVARDGYVRIWKTTFLDKPGELKDKTEEVPEINNFKKDSLGYLSLVKEFPLEAARKLLFLSESSLVVGESSGRLLELSL